MRQEPPFAVQLEPVEGCTLACSFCALQQIRNNGASWEMDIHGKHSLPYKMMTLDTLQTIARQIEELHWNPRIELAMHGEPTIHPKLPTIIALLRKYLEHAYILLTTNGSGIQSAERVARLFDAGLNTLAMDDYRHATWAPKARAALLNYAQQKVPVYDYPYQKEGNPHQRVTSKRIVIVRDISSNKSGTHQITNQGGGSGPPHALLERCAKPFRELSIRWNGNVAICCDDWLGRYKIGNVRDELEYGIDTNRLEELWNHPRYIAARKFLYHKKRTSLAPCNVCNVRTYRNGLLPDKLGKHSMPHPSGKDEQQVTEAMRGVPYSRQVKQ